MTLLLVANTSIFEDSSSSSREVMESFSALSKVLPLHHVLIQNNHTDSNPLLYTAVSIVRIEPCTLLASTVGL